MIASNKVLRSSRYKAAAMNGKADLTRAYKPEELHGLRDEAKLGL